MLINDNGVDTYYYYLFNLQGDIVGIMDSSGNTVTEYTYDAWGQLLTTTGNTELGNKNPLRYRGYYYDSETGFYYVSSRYYDPEISRWINIDAQLNTSLGVLGCNMYAYCLNNPVNKVDYGGNKPGDLFNTMDEAARDAAIYMSNLSFEHSWEYGANIYSVSKWEIRKKEFSIVFKVFGKSVTLKGSLFIPVKNKYYTYEEPYTDESPFGIRLQPNTTGELPEAFIHTHPLSNKTEFSDFVGVSSGKRKGDKAMAIKYNCIAYVYGGNGEIRKFYPATEEDIPIFYDLPKNPCFYD